MSAVGTHSSPEGLEVSEWPTGSADADARTTNGADADTASPWAVQPLTDDEREHAQARVREIGAQLRQQRGRTR